MKVNGQEYTIIKLLGRGKGGYSYLAEKDGKKYVLKQIHHEPCDYYTFGNKIEAEMHDYDRLRSTGIRIPQMFDIDIKNERILKQYIDGPTIDELVKNNQMKDIYLEQGKEMARQACSAGLNIDYFPTNFVVQDEKIYYIDYECNEYMEKWNFENWGVKYWYKVREMRNDEYPLLDDFLYEAIFVPEGAEAPPRSVIENPELQVYVEQFGSQEHDKAVVAEVDGKIVGAAWARIMKDYGHVDDETPSLAISLYKEYRGLGMGTTLLRNILSLLKMSGYNRVSLSVQKANYAAKMYEKVGFQIWNENEEEYIMICQL